MEGEILGPCEALEMIDDFKKWLRTSTSLAKSSKSDYIYYLNTILIFFCEHSLKFTKEDWEEYCKLRSNEFRPDYLNMHNSTLKKFGEFLRDKEVISYNPFLEFRRFPRTEPIPVRMNIKEIKSFLSAVESQNDKLMITLLYTLDINLEEFSNLYHENINTKNRTIRIGEKLIPISKKIISLLPPKPVPLISASSDQTPILRGSRGKPLHVRVIQRKVKEIGKKAGVEKDISPRVVQKIPEFLADSGLNINEIFNILGPLPKNRIEIIIKEQKMGIDKLVTFLSSNIMEEVSTSAISKEISIRLLYELFPKDIVESIIEDLDIEDQISVLDLPEILEIASTRRDEFLASEGLEDITEYIEDTSLKIPDDLDKRLVILKESLVLAFDFKKLKEIALALVDGDIIISGAPGTGKTVIASRLADIFFSDTLDLGTRGKYCNIVTATSDWTTQETVGGLILGENGKVVRYDGCITQAIQRARELASVGKSYWLVIDEFNRADIDKAFGAMFTAIENNILSHPYSDFNDRDDDPIASDLLIPNSFRIIGTMNTFDKNSLMQLSYGLQRRFRIIPIELPDEEEEIKIVDIKILQVHKEIPNVSKVMKENNYKKAKDTVFEFAKRIRTSEQVKFEIGTALILNTLNQIVVSLIYDPHESYKIHLQNSIISNICPQFEGILEDSYSFILKILEEMELGLVKNHLERQKERTLSI